MELSAVCKTPKEKGVLLTKTYMVMRISFLLLIIALHVSAKGHTQHITLVREKIRIKDALNEINKQSGYSFIGNIALLETAPLITLSLKDATISEAMDECLKGLPYDYTIRGSIILIRLKELPVTPDPTPPSDLHGRVTDSLGNPLAGASVTVKGTSKGTQTDIHGRFELKGLEDNVTLVFSFTGFEKREVRTNGRTELNLVLTHSSSPLDEVQVIAYGTTTQRLSTSNIGTVDRKAIEQQIVTNPLLALEGEVPGLFVTQASGVSGTGVTVTIQGESSIANGNDPFYVIDGVPYPSRLLPNRAISLLGQSGDTGPYIEGGNPFSYINTSDIESISVMKGADATAIYGSRAANGAILITTKKGKSGKAKASLGLRDGWGALTRRLKLLNTKQYLDMRREALRNDGLSISPTDYDLNGAWDTTRDVDWQKLLLDGTAHYLDVSGDLSGGNANTQYLLGCTYNRETSVFYGNFSDQKTGAHFSFTTQSDDHKLHLSFTGNYQYDNNQLPTSDETFFATQFAPVAPPLYNKDGSLNWQYNSAGQITFNNPLYSLQSHYYTTGNNLLSSAQLSYQLLPGLEVQANLGYNNLQIDETITGPTANVPPIYLATQQRFANYGHNITSSWSVEPRAEYRKSIGGSRIDILAGFSLQRQNNNGVQQTGVGYSSDLLLRDIHSASLVTADNSTNFIYKYNAGFGRLGYNWKDKYLVNINIRRDGSSRFGPASQFHTFGSIGAGWVFSSESWLQQHASFLSFGKLRSSYGTTGNDQIGDYQFLTQYVPSTYQVAYQGITSLQPLGLSNPNFRWEENRKLEFGLDLGFLKDRIIFNANYSRNRSSNQLLFFTLPVLTGYGGVTENFPATVQNSGWEFTAKFTPVKQKDFSWVVTANATIPHNKLVAFKNIANTFYNYSLLVGKPTSIQRVNNAAGVNTATGEYQFYDKTNKPVDNPDTNSAVVNPAPKIYGGIRNSFQYKGLELEFFFQFCKQIGRDYSLGNHPGPLNFGQGNQPTYVLSRWQKPGDKTSVQKFSTTSASINQFYLANGASGQYGDASYLRLKNLSLSWSLPAFWDKKIHISSFRIFIEGQNLLTITKFKGLDPENKSTINIPPLKMLTTGLRIQL